MSDLISAVQATLAKSAKLSADLRQECEQSVKLQRQSQELRSEAAEARRRSFDLRKKRRAANLRKEK